MSKFNKLSEESGKPRLESPESPETLVTLPSGRQQTVCVLGYANADLRSPCPLSHTHPADEKCELNPTRTGAKNAIQRRN